MNHPQQKNRKEGGDLSRPGKKILHSASCVYGWVSGTIFVVNIRLAVLSVRLGQQAVYLSRCLCYWPLPNLIEACLFYYDVPTKARICLANVRQQCMSFTLLKTKPSKLPFRYIFKWANPGFFLFILHSFQTQIYGRKL